LEALYPDRPLLGTSDEERALILDWNHRLFNDVFKPIGDLFRNTNPAFAGRALPGTLDTDQIPELAERGRSQLLHTLTILNGELTSRDYVAGDSFSMADIDLLASLHFAGWAAKLQPDESLTALTEWRQRAQAALG
jgi:glutathione S-transferase